MLSNKYISFLVKKALEEDNIRNDITTDSIVTDEKCRAYLIAKAQGVVAGLNISKLVFQTVDKNIKFVFKVKDGDKVKKNKILAQISGNANSILKAERTALNFIQQLSGVATLTFQFVQKVKPYKTVILDTRKTVPMMRVLQKYAVRCGGGYNHRINLGEKILIKDNHIKIAGGVSKAIEQVRKKLGKNIKIEVEIDNLKDLRIALNYNVHTIMLDNMKGSLLKNAVRMINGKSKVEISGGVNLKNVREIAKLGVNYISIGALTHSAPSLDISLEL